MQVVLHGVRGSTPAPGLDFLKVGGNTSCVAIRLAGDNHPSLLLDAGTGLSSVARTFAGTPFRGDILLTHLHWDHMQGLPFFSAGDRDDAHVRLRLPAQHEAPADDPGAAAALLGRAMSPPHFPIGPEGLRGDWTFSAIEPGQVPLDRCAVTALEVPHHGGRTFGYRVEADGGSLAYLPDHYPSANPDGGLELAAGVDVLCHGAMFADDEQTISDAYGHGTVGEAMKLAQAAGVGTLVLIHHAPTRTDEQVDALAQSIGDSDINVIIGRDGEVVLDTGSEFVSSSPGDDPRSLSRAQTGRSARETLRRPGMR